MIHTRSNEQKLRIETSKTGTHSGNWRGVGQRSKHFTPLILVDGVPDYIPISEVRLPTVVRTTNPSRGVHLYNDNVIIVVVIVTCSKGFQLRKKKKSVKGK